LRSPWFASDLLRELLKVIDELAVEVIDAPLGLTLVLGKRGNLPP
jgi:hypothetical protein